jgi:hypothetical protein
MNFGDLQVFTTVKQKTKDGDIKGILGDSSYPG